MEGKNGRFAQNIIYFYISEMLAKKIMLMSLRGGSEKKLKKFFIINRGGFAHFDWSKYKIKNHISEVLRRRRPRPRLQILGILLEN